MDQSICYTYAPIVLLMLAPFLAIHIPFSLHVHSILLVWSGIPLAYECECFLLRMHRKWFPPNLFMSADERIVFPMTFSEEVQMGFNPYQCTLIYQCKHHHLIACEINWWIIIKNVGLGSYSFWLDLLGNQYTISNWNYMIKLNTEIHHMSLLRIYEHN